MHSMDADTYWREMNEAQLLEEPCVLHGAPVFTPPPVRDCVQQLQPGESQFVWVVCSVPEANMQPDSTVEWNCLPLNIAMVLEREVAKYTRQKSRAQKALAVATHQVETGGAPVPNICFDEAEHSSEQPRTPSSCTFAYFSLPQIPWRGDEPDMDCPPHNAEGRRHSRIQGRLYHKDRCCVHTRLRKDLAGATG